MLNKDQWLIDVTVPVPSISQSVSTTGTKMCFFEPSPTFLSLFTQYVMQVED